MQEDKAVSPVIAVILMVAITVVLAAVVYVWVSSFSGDSNMAPRSIGLALTNSQNGNLTLTVTSASPSLLWSELQLLVNGNSTVFNSPTGSVYGGQTFTFPASSGNLITLVDTKANSVIATLTAR